MRKRLIPATVVAFALALPAAAAGSDTEPNDGIHEYDGPLVAETPYDGVLSSRVDRDWYAFYVSGPGLVTIEFTNVAEGLGYHADLVFMDDSGGELDQAGAYPGEADTIEYTVPGAGKYYLMARGNVYDAWTNDSYTLEVSGPLVGGAPAATAQSTPNNNQDAGSAFGPLVGGALYGGRIDASGEEDWFHFHTAASGTFTVEVVGVPDEGFNTHVELYRGSGALVDDVLVRENQIVRISYTGAGRDTYKLRFFHKFDAAPGDGYRFRIDPAQLITPTPPPPPPPPVPGPKLKPPVDRALPQASPACDRARTLRGKKLKQFKKARKKTRTAKRKIRAANRPRTRRKWRRAKRKWAVVTKKRRVALRKANQRRKRVCA